ncbi:MAG: hypothetical protein R3C60_09200 [Parvularculaceae bacterium]
MNPLSQTSSAPQTDSSPGGRNDAAAEARRRSAAELAQRQQESQARTADRLSEVREAVARVLGLNTRLSITRPENSLNFVYRAIDIDTGEVVNEWPEDRFIDLVRGVSQDVRTDVNAGAILDSVA